MKTDPEPYIKKFGEKHRGVISRALQWLDEAEPKWNLKKPIGRKSFVRGLVSKVRYNKDEM